MIIQTPTYSMKQYLISHICLLMLFVTCNVSINAKSAEDGFRKANYCFKGAGKKTVHGLQSGYFDNIVVDVLVKPRSVKEVFHCRANGWSKWLPIDSGWKKCCI